MFIFGTNVFQFIPRGHSYGNYCSSFHHKIKFQDINKVKIIVNLIWEPRLFLQSLGSKKYDKIKKLIDTKNFHDNK